MSCHVRYRLFSRVPSTLDLVRAKMRSHISGRGSALVDNPENARNPVRFVRRLLQLRETFSRMVAEAFESDQAFQKTLGAVPGGLELLVALGFREAEAGVFALPMDADLDALRARFYELEAAGPLLKKRAQEKARAAKLEAQKPLKAAPRGRSRGPVTLDPGHAPSTCGRYVPPAS